MRIKIKKKYHIVQKSAVSKIVNYKNPEFSIFNHDLDIQSFLEPEKK